MALQRFTVPALLVATLAVAPACGDSTGGGNGGAPGTGGATSTSTGPATGSVVASTAIGSTASSGGDGGDAGTTTTTTGEGGGGGGDTATTGSSGGGGGGDGHGGGGGDGHGGGGGDVTTSTSTASTSTASSSSSGGGENCIVPPVIDPAPPGVHWSDWPVVPGLCANDAPGRIFPFTITRPMQATISRGHTLNANPPYERSVLLEGCQDPGPITPVDFSGQTNPPGHLFDAHHCRTQSMELQPGTYQFACCQCSIYFDFILEEPPPPPTNTTCATATPLPFPGSQEQPRIVDAQPRYYRYELAEDLPPGVSLTLGFDGVGQQSGAYYQLVTVTDGCDGPVLRDGSVGMCTNGPALMDDLPSAAGTYVIRVSDIDPGTHYSLDLYPSF